MQTYKNLFPDTTSASIPAVTTLRSSLIMYVLFVYNTFFPLNACFVNSSLELLSEEPSYKSETWTLTKRKDNYYGYEIFREQTGNQNLFRESENK
jgi:hypothetical protein